MRFITTSTPASKRVFVIHSSRYFGEIKLQTKIISRLSINLVTTLHTECWSLSKLQMSQISAKPGGRPQLLQQYYSSSCPAKICPFLLYESLFSLFRGCLGINKSPHHYDSESRNGQILAGQLEE